MRRRARLLRGKLTCLHGAQLICVGYVSCYRTGEFARIIAGAGIPPESNARQRRRPCRYRGAWPRPAHCASGPAREVHIHSRRRRVAFRPSHPKHGRAVPNAEFQGASRNRPRSLPRRREMRSTRCDCENADRGPASIDAPAVAALRAIDGPFSYPSFTPRITRKCAAPATRRAPANSSCRRAIRSSSAIRSMAGMTTRPPGIRTGSPWRLSRVARRRSVTRGPGPGVITRGQEDGCRDCAWNGLMLKKTAAGDGYCAAASGRDFGLRRADSPRLFPSRRLHALDYRPRRGAGENCTATGTRNPTRVNAFAATPTPALSRGAAFSLCSLSTKQHEEHEQWQCVSRLISR